MAAEDPVADVQAQAPDSEVVEAVASSRVVALPGLLPQRGPLLVRHLPLRSRLLLRAWASAVVAS